MIKNNNTASDGSESIFFLEAYFNSVSIQAELLQGDNPEQVKEIIGKMEAICEKNGIVSHYVSQARTQFAILTYYNNQKLAQKEEYDFQLERNRRIAKEPIEMLE